MKFFFDARYVRLDFHDGVSRYTTELANAVARHDSEVTFIISDSRQLAFLPPDVKHFMFHTVDSWREPFASVLLNRFKPDVVFTPMQTMGSLGRKFKLVLTLHDMTYYMHRLPPPQAKGIVRPLWRLFHLAYWPQRLLLNLADAVATVSQTSAQEIRDANLTKRPLIVVSNAARDLSPLLKHPVTQGAMRPKNLVFMGTLLPYKNAETLITAMAQLPGRTLHICSKVSPKRREQLQALVPKGAHVVFHNGVSDETYADLLATDAIMVSASKAEGFGLPLAEALMLGVPTVVSDLPFFHEVGGHAPVYADPESPNSFARAIQKLDDVAERHKRIEIGKAHIQKFSWDKSAEVLLAACNKLS